MPSLAAEVLENVAYMLQHNVRGCGAVFAPSEAPKRLIVDAKHACRYKYQDLLVGVCPRCKIDVMGWIGIDFMLRPVKYFGINKDRHSDWINRYDADLVRDIRKTDHGTVTGSVLDRQSGKYRYRDVIEVK